MEDDQLPPPNPPAPPAPPVRPRSVTCDFCQCRLGADGGVLETGARARTVAGHESKITTLEAEVTALKDQLRLAGEKISTLEREAREEVAAEGGGAGLGRW